MTSKKLLYNNDKPDKMIFSDLGCENQCLTKLIIALKHGIGAEYFGVVILTVSSSNSDLKSSLVKPLLVKPTNLEELSLRVCQDGELRNIPSINYSLSSTKGSNMCDELLSKVTEIKWAFKCLKLNPEMKALLILICCGDHEQFSMDHKLLGAGEAAQLASTCKQPSIPCGKTACFIIAGTRKVKIELVYVAKSKSIQE